MPVNPYDDRKVSLRRPHGNGDLDIVRASYTRRKANVTEALMIETFNVCIFLFFDHHLHISIFTFCMLFVLMYFMYMLCFCTLCSYATCEWPEFYVNKDMFCSVLYSLEQYLPAKKANCANSDQKKRQTDQGFPTPVSDRNFSDNHHYKIIWKCSDF